ncbi:hypothetical protein [Streptomyces sp. NPDC005525]|uniref:hypothetical protein n=1 Tax=Streptomyces sp. NPDC005525 TaxID=3364720 RepID=UPI0036D1B6C1
MARWTRRPELFGFVPESDFERAAPLLAAATAETPVFTARLDAAERASGGPPSGELPLFQNELHELGDASVND